MKMMKLFFLLGLILCAEELTPINFKKYLIEMEEDSNRSILTISDFNLSSYVKIVKDSNETLEILVNDMNWSIYMPPSTQSIGRFPPPPDCEFIFCTEKEELLK